MSFVLQTVFFFCFSQSVFIVMGSPLAHFEPVDVASPTIDGACMEIDRLLMAARDILVPKLLCFFRHCECGCYDYEKRMADNGTPYRSPESSSLQSVGRHVVWRKGGVGGGAPCVCRGETGLPARLPRND